jgi:DNA-directed RNA polymerase subunit beta'
MMRWVKIEDVGDTEFLIQQQVDRFRFAARERRGAKGSPRATEPGGVQGAPPIQRWKRTSA